MEGGRVRAALRFDGAAWRRFAELGCVYGPEWWKRGSPPLIAAIIYGIARNKRDAGRPNQRAGGAPAADRAPCRARRDPEGRRRGESWRRRPHRPLRIVGGRGARADAPRAPRE